MKKEIFKAYDIRGIYPSEIDEKDIYKIVQAYCSVLSPKTIALGKDVRTSSPSLWESAKNGLVDAGTNVLDLGTISTDMLYFATANYGLDGGITVTASHNPREYNGAKMVEKGASPLSKERLLPEIQELAGKEDFQINNEIKGQVTQTESLWEDYVMKVRSFGNLSSLRPMKIVINANFGLAGKVFKKVFEGSPIEIFEINCEPDGSFPKGRPDPLIPENREETKAKIKEIGADLGFAWDGDADRCFIYDENGNDVEGCFMGALLSKIVLEQAKEEDRTVVYDPRIVWAVTEIIKENGGTPVPSRVGHTLIKTKMREVNAILAVESSGHFYFKDYYYCDNGMIPAVLVLSYLNKEGISLSQAMEKITRGHCVSGEINFVAENKDEILSNFKQKFSDAKHDEIDGLSIEYDNWRFNVRKSNTEPLLRLNVETRDQKLLVEKTEEISGLINEWKK